MPVIDESDSVTGAVDRLLSMAAEADVVRVLASDSEPGLVSALARAVEGGHGVAISIVPASWDVPGSHLLDLVAVMDRLRSPGGCPWDAAQTHESLVEYLVEEAYEAVEAIETGDDDDLREELGDVLLQVLFHARIGEEREVPWSIDDVADGIVEKLVARHPHVFSDVDAATAAEVERNWAALKAAEKGRESVTDGVPLALPALVLASKLLSRSKAVDVVAADPVALGAVDAALASVGGDLGGLLLALVVRSRADGVDAEAALRNAVRRLRERIRLAEGLDGDSVTR